MDDYKEDIRRILNKHPPNIVGGCFVATRDLIKRRPELKEKVYKIKNIKHCVAITPDGRIIDTQYWQLNFILTMPDIEKNRYVFDKRDYETIIGGRKCRNNKH
jgi:hypothetical protein